MTFRLMITHFQVRFLGLQLAARNILFDAFHILTPYDVAYEKSFSFMNIYILYLTIIPRARIGSESIVHEAEGRMGY